MDRKDQISATVGFGVLILIGLWAILDPAALEGYEAIGPRSGLKQMLADYWGRGLGIGMVLVGGLAIVGVNQTE